MAHKPVEFPKTKLKNLYELWDGKLRRTDKEPKSKLNLVEVAKTVIHIIRFTLVLTMYNWFPIYVHANLNVGINCGSPLSQMILHALLLKPPQYPPSTADGRLGIPLAGPAGEASSVSPSPLAGSEN